MGRIESCMTEPSGDGGDIDISLEQVHRGGVTDNVGSDILGV